jgi:hypothetical protein
MTSRRKTLYIFIFCLAFVFTAGEFYARVRHKKEYLTSNVGQDPVFHHIPRPYYSGRMQSEGDFDMEFTTNNKGMRSRSDYTYAKGEDVFRIALLGDSFAFGTGVTVDEVLSSRLEALLNGDGGFREE